MRWSLPGVRNARTAWWKRNGNHGSVAKLSGRLAPRRRHGSASRYGAVTPAVSTAHAWIHRNPRRHPLERICRSRKRVCTGRPGATCSAANMPRRLVARSGLPNDGLRRPPAARGSRGFAFSANDVRQTRPRSCTFRSRMGSACGGRKVVCVPHVRGDAIALPADGIRCERRRDYGAHVNGTLFQSRHVGVGQAPTEHRFGMRQALDRP